MCVTESAEYVRELEEVLAELDLSALRGRTVMVTGAAGMLGSCVVDLLRQYGRCRVIAVGRDAASGEARFGPAIPSCVFLGHDVCRPMPETGETADYIIHAASNADPVRMSQDPVGTLLSNVQGTKNLLDYGLTHGMKRFLFVSSGEVYGQPEDSMEGFPEEYCGPLDLFSPRSCYPSGKRAAEVLCQSYVRQHATDAVIVRPCHLFGPTMTARDSRAVSEFLRSAANGQDIVMKSAGQLERSHCYIVDAVRALFLVLLRGECGRAYNIADRRYQMRICDFAQRAARAGGSQVIWEAPSEVERSGYARTSRAVLDPSRLEALGWRGLNDHAIEKTVAILREGEGRCAACCQSS